MLTTFDTDDMILDALRAGARGFLLQDTPPERFIQGVLAVAHGLRLPCHEQGRCHDRVQLALLVREAQT